MDFRTCKLRNYVKQIKVDHNLFDSLVKSSSKKLQSQKRLEMDDTTAGSKISLTYDALRELLEAIAISKGYKIYNHECYTSFLKEVMNESALGDQFDRFRRIRNDINYYGKDVLASEARAIINEMGTFIKILRLKF